MPTITIDSSGWKRLSNKLRDYFHSGIHPILENASLKISNKYKAQIRAGKTGADNFMMDVSEATMKSPIRAGSDKAIRGEVRSSRSPLYARGRAIESIKSIKTAKGFEIGPTTSHGQMIFGVNEKARVTKKGNRIPARNPFVVSDVQLDIIEKSVLESIDRIIKG